MKKKNVSFTIIGLKKKNISFTIIAFEKEKNHKLCEFGSLKSDGKSRNNKWYFVTKIVLTYCEKKLFYVVIKKKSANFFEITK